jgi:hypothetical protein
MPRITPRVETSFYLNKVVDGVPYLVRARDMSRGGLYLQKLIEPRFQSGSRFAVEFALPNSEDVLWADVDPVWDDGRAGVGLKFRSLTPRVARLIDEFLSGRVEAQDVGMAPR